MESEQPGASIFSQKLDRAAFTAYFLGAVVPLVSLGFVAERYVFPTLSDPFATYGLMAMIASVAALSFGSFLVLRRTTRRSLRRMERDTERVTALLETSGALAASQDEQDAAVTATRGAHVLSEASAAFTLMRKGPPESLELVASAGENALKLWESRSAELLDLARPVALAGRPAVRAPGKGTPAAAGVPIQGDDEPLGVLLAVQASPSASLEPEHVNALSTLAGLASVALRNTHLRDTQRNFFIHVTDLLVTALDSHLTYHSGHGTRVAQLANPMGREMGFDDRRMQRLHFAALLHDIGMLKLDRQMQHNPRTCQKHAVLGFRMLNRILLWQDLAPIVHSHHEWFDGSGYPDGLAGEAIPLESRIIGLCDAYDAMTSRSSYKVTVRPELAVEEIRDASGTQFDPRVVQAFLSLVESGVVSTSTE